MTSTCYNNYNITKFFTNFETNRLRNIDCLKNNRDIFIENFNSRYNNLSQDTKRLLDFCINLLNVNKNIEASLEFLKNQHEELQKNYLDVLSKLANYEKKSGDTSSESEDNICVICMSNPRECVYVNCGHFCACSECCEKMELQCPMCRQTSGFVKLISI